MTQESDAEKQFRLVTLSAEVGRALTTLDAPEEMLRACAEALVRNLGAAFARIWTLNGSEEVLVLRASAGLYTHTDGPHGRVPVGRFKIGLIAQERRPHLTNDVPGDPRVSDREWAAREGMVSFAGYPLVVDERLVGVVALFARRPLSEETLQALGSVADQIAVGISRVETERALAESGERLRAALSASGTGTFRWDTRTDALEWDENLDRLFGLDPGVTARTLDNFVAMVHPDDRAGVIARCRRCAEEGADFDMEFRVVQPDGSLRWLSDQGRTLCDAQGRPLYMTGACVDITARRQAEEDLRRSREDLRLAVAAARIGTFYCDWPLDKIIWNDTCKQHFFLPADADVDFALFYSLLHPDDREPTRRAIERALADRVEYDVEYRTLAADGRARWVNAVGRFHYGADGDPIRFDGITLDITARKAAEEEVRRRAEREALLNRLGDAIRATTDPDLIQETAAALVGEALGADRCYFSVLDPQRDAVRIARDWRRPGLPSLAGDYHLAQYQGYVDALYADGTAAITDARAPDLPPAVGRVLGGFGSRAFLAVPLLDGGRFTAALAAAMTDGPRAWTPDEVSLVEAVLTRTRTAVEAARVHQREHRIAEQLAQALQPATPAAVPGLDLAEYYRPALEDQGVGGDFSDVFSTDKGVTFLVVGDLSGKGLAAASQVAMVRHMLRFALYNGRTVAGPVASLNATLADNSLLSGFSTLFVGRYDAGARALTYVNCGQDAGLVLRAATGETEPLPPTGPILGAIGGASYTEQTVTLRAGDVLALYTDGLTEAGPTRTALLTGDGVADLLRQQVGIRDAQQIVARLMDGVDAYAGRGVRDDQCLLVAVVRD